MVNQETFSTKSWNITMLAFSIGLALSLQGCGDLVEPVGAEQNQLITLLGADTIAIEQYRRHEQTVDAKVLFLVPKTTLVKYRLNLDDSFRLSELTEQYLYPHFLDRDSVVRERKLRFQSDSILVIDTKTIRRINKAEVKTVRNTLPFLDLVHWPYEVIIQKMEERGLEILDQPLLSGHRTLHFEVRKTAADSFIIRHPSRGNIVALMGDDGRLLQLDAQSTTRKLKVNRSGPANLNFLADQFSRREEGTGTGRGALSGRGRTEQEIEEALITVDYGRPAKRGRQLFGSLVPWGEVWRTGANMATHLSTDTTLLVEGQLTIPPGEYTIFTIPEMDGGLLIFNRQTGQNGVNYDPSLNLGQVPMKKVVSTGDREYFTIEVVEKEIGGALRLAWGSTQYEVHFDVQ